MFKDLREKITTTHSNNRKKLVNNNDDSTGNDTNESLKNTGFQNISRFSSISSLVSDVSSAFSKTMTAPQHIQPFLYDNESISEYDSIAGGDVLSKDELFQRFQRAKLLAKRYKTRYLEVAESYKKLELENTKMSQALSDSQDKQICRIGELKEQIELDKKAKNDVEENYMLMMEEKAEVINVLKLQISLLKEGKDLPPELEQQIKTKHEIQIQIEKKREEEMKELKSVLAQRDNLLHRCKEKISSLNSKLNELEMKHANVTEVAISSDNSAKLESQAEENHSEIIKNLTFEFEEKKLKYESEISAKFNEKYEELKLEEQKIKEKLRLLSEENESLIEQLDIKSKIVQDLFQNSPGNVEDDYYNADKLRQCHNILQNYPRNAHSIISELSSLFDMPSGQGTLESCFGERDEQIFGADLNESSEISDLQEQNKYLLQRIEHLENMKSICEEENHNREKELKQSNSIIEDERKNYVLRSYSLNGEIDNLKAEKEQLIHKSEEALNKFTECQLQLSKTESDLKKILQENEILLKSNHSLEQNLSDLEIDKSKLIHDSKNLCEEFNNLELKLTSIQKEYDNNLKDLGEKKDECKLLKDRIDELMESVTQLNTEKNELLLEINSVHVDTSNQEQISLSMIEMQHRLEQEIVELKDQIASDNKLQQDRYDEITHLKKEINNLLEKSEKSNQDLEESNIKNSNLIEENDNLLKSINHLTEESELIKSKLDTILHETETKDRETSELLENLENQNKIAISCEEQIKILQQENQILIQNNNKISEECEKLSGDINDKSQLLESEIQEKLLIINKLKLLESMQTSLDENIQKQEILVEENNSLKDIIQCYKENENKSVSLTEQNDLQMKSEDEYKVSHKLELFGKEIGSLLQGSVKDKDDLLYLNKEISKLATCTLLIENRIQELDSTFSSNDKEELFNDEQVMLIKELQEQAEEYLKTISCNEETMKTLQNSIEDKTIRLEEEISLKNDSINTVKLMELYLSKFCGWIEDLINVVISSDNHDQIIDSMSSTKYWSSEMESECANSNILIAIGKEIDKLLSITGRLDSSLLEIRKTTADSTNLQIETQKTLDSISSEVSEIFIMMNAVSVEEDLMGKLESIKKSWKSYSEEKNEMLSDIESLYSSLSEQRTKNDISLLNIIPTKSPLYELVKRINDILLNFKSDLSMEHELNIKLHAEYEILDGKVEKSNSLFLKFFTQLIHIFHFTDISVTHVADINKTAKQVLIKGLKEYVKTHEQLKNEANQLRVQLNDKKNELAVVIETKTNVEREYEDLKTLVANDRDKLIAAREELENSMRQLNAVVDEKGRIDEEKQSLRKQLKELNENINSLKTEFEDQRLEKQRLEVKFDETLEKVKSNNLALEEMYKSELEKEHGYQRNLEEQIATSKESQSRMLSESEKKLEDVLNQSEQLLELNYQYKKLLDEAKVENLNVLSSCAKFENENSVLQSRLNQLDLEIKHLSDSRDDIERTHNETAAERDKLGTNYTILENESRQFTETIKNLQATQENKDKELEDLNQQLERMKSTNQDLLNQLKTLEHSNKVISGKEKLMNEKSLELATQQVEWENNFKAIQKKLENSEQHCRNINIEKKELQTQLTTLQTSCTSLKSRNCEIENRIETYKSQIDDLNLEMEQIKTRNDIDIEELKQQFMEEKSNIEDDYNRKIKKLAKEFNDQTFEKEKDFQKTFEEALRSIRSDESHIRNDLKSTIEELNRSTIELECERNQLLDTISDNDITIKKLRNQIEYNERDLASSQLQIEDLRNVIAKLENDGKKSKKISKTIQTIDSSSFYEEPFVGGVTIKDHEVLLMHCSDIEEQLKQLQSENIELKKHEVLFTNQNAVLETATISQRMNQLNRQPSGSNDISKSGILFQGGSFRSPNPSCSDYPFCPVPITEATDYEYLHDVLLKYMTGMETEILAKVVCTVMKFSHEETNRVLLFEQDRNKFIRRIL